MILRPSSPQPAQYTDCIILAPGSFDKKLFYHPWKIIHACVSSNVQSKTPFRGKQTSITRFRRLSHYHVSKN